MNKYYRVIILVFLGLMLGGYAGLSLAVKLPHIVILATGGTIAGKAKSSVAAAYQPGIVSVQSMLKAVPELSKIAHVTGEQIAQIGSNNMTNKIWLKLAKRANQLLTSPKVDGIVITHGTDTLEETAYFLDLTVKSNKPIVITGAMRPANGLSSDGALNLFNAVSLAASTQAKGKGVLVTLNDTIQGARDVTKTNTTNVDTFQARDMGNLGYILNGRIFFYRAPLRKHTLQSEFSITKLKRLPRVDIIYSYVNNQPTFINAAIKAGTRGIVMAGTGDGSINDGVLAALIKAHQKGIIVARSSRTGSGRVNLGIKEFDDRGILVADDLSPQKARILLMLALTKTKNPNKIQRMFFEY